MLMTDLAATTIDRYYASFASRDRDGFLALWTADGEFHDPPREDRPPARGRDQLAELFDASFGIADAFEYTRHHTWICGREAAVHATCRIRGEQFVADLPLVHVFAIAADGRIASLKTFIDPSQAVAIEGTLPEPPA